MSCSEVFFKIKLNIFLDTSILKIILYIIKINNFRVDVSGISAKKTSLVSCCGCSFSTAFVIVPPCSSLLENLRYRATSSYGNFESRSSRVASLSFAPAVQFIPNFQT